MKIQKEEPNKKYDLIREVNHLMEVSEERGVLKERLRQLKINGQILSLIVFLFYMGLVLLSYLKGEYLIGLIILEIYMVLLIFELYLFKNNHKEVKKYDNENRVRGRTGKFSPVKNG